MLSAIDTFLMDDRPRRLAGLRRGLVEFLYFGVKEARACLFVGLFFAAIFLMPRAWSAVHISKWSSWSLLVIMTFTIVASLKHVKAKIHIAEE